MAWFSKREAWIESLVLSDAVQQHYSEIYRFCSKFVGADAAEDVTQETFITAHKRLSDFQGRSSMKTWLFSIALNHCRNERRRKKPLPLEDWNQPSGADAADQLIAAQALREALAKLTPEHREVVVLHETEGLNYEECSTILGIPVGTVKSRLHHAFKSLRNHLSPGESAL